ncbi:MAG: hypothetical protein LBI62_08865 [Candidatus Accumulibacter sp.]|nr:hypothetical protein [Accumulibacter sp.]
MCFVARIRIIDGVAQRDQRRCGERQRQSDLYAQEHFAAKKNRVFHRKAPCSHENEKSASRPDPGNPPDQDTKRWERNAKGRSGFFTRMHTGHDGREKSRKYWRACSGGRRMPAMRVIEGGGKRQGKKKLPAADARSAGRSSCYFFHVAHQYENPGSLLFW